jgi:hypothetical protein
MTARRDCTPLVRRVSSIRERSHVPSIQVGREREDQVPRIAWVTHFREFCIMATQSIAGNRFPWMVAAGAGVCLAAVAVVAVEASGAGIVAFVVLRSLLVVAQGLVVVGLVYNANRRVQLARAR